MYNLVILPMVILPMVILPMVILPMVIQSQVIVYYSIHYIIHIYWCDSSILFIYTIYDILNIIPYHRFISMVIQPIIQQVIHSI
jgi:hypothetical protein